MLFAAASLWVSSAAFAQTLPGEGMASPAFAGAIFAEACIKTGPSYRNADRTLDANGLVKIPTGTFYHTDVNLSVKPVPGSSCSIVFRVTQSPDRAAEAFERAIAERAPNAQNAYSIKVNRFSADTIYVSARTSP